MTIKDAIVTLNANVVIACERAGFSSATVKIVEDALDTIEDALKKQEPKPPIHIHEEYPEHDWKRDEDGNIDEWFMDEEFHHGPGCKRCGYSFCIYCNSNGWNEKPCVIDYYQCPKCGTRIFKDDGKTLYCERCGQAVTWE